MRSLLGRTRARELAAVCGFVLTITLAFVTGVFAQEPLLQPGEAYATRFSGTTVSGGQTVIDTSGTVGSIIDIRNPGQAPKGQHWIDEPQRNPVTAGQVGQVFGVALELDDAGPPNIFLTATSAFGLHRTPDNADWMAGMWGPDGGPGTVYRLNRDNDYQPEVFANITLDGRENTGAGLGNIAYDKWNKQLYVSDLETGMIHRLRASDGADLGHYDHGADGRAQFYDAPGGAQKSLAAQGFDPASRARINDCPGGNFATTPACWNFADFRRRVWGVGVRRDSSNNEIRLYYATWGSKGFRNPAWAGAGDDQRNAIWSVRIHEDGNFDASNVRREFFLPDFFSTPLDIARAGPSNPVSDIAFPKCDLQNVMLVSERGGVRNLGLDADNPFAWPHESRVIRYELGENGDWLPVGRYDVGFYDRKNDRQPFMRANSSGGVDFGLGYAENWEIDPGKLNDFVWMTGDALCSADGMCLDPGTGRHTDSSQVHGSQGTPEFAYDLVAPDAAFQPYPAAGPPYPATGPNQSFMIDFDINVDASGNPVAAELARNDATKIGDIEIYQPCEGPSRAEYPPDVYPPDWPPPGTRPPGWPPPGWPPPGGPPDIELVKTGPAECVLLWPGVWGCKYTITLNSVGPGTYHGPFFVRDWLPVGAWLAGYQPQPPWNCGQIGLEVQCHRPPVPGGLPPGGSVTLTLDINVPWAGPLPKEVWNCALLDWPMANPNDPVAVRRAVQEALWLRGFYGGPIDGLPSPALTAAIAAYQAANGLPATGTINDALIASLALGGPGDADPGNDFMCIPSVLGPAAVGPVVPLMGEHSKDMTHRRHGTAVHTKAMSQKKPTPPPHTKAQTHRKLGSEPPTTPPEPTHTKAQTHRKYGTEPTHTRIQTHRKYGTKPKHTKAQTHRKYGTKPKHNRIQTHRKYGTKPKHNRIQTHRKYGTKPKHTKAQTHNKYGTRQPPGGEFTPGPTGPPPATTRPPPATTRPPPAIMIPMVPKQPKFETIPGIILPMTCPGGQILKNGRCVVP